MKLPNSCRWQPTGVTVGEGRQGQVAVVEDKSGEFVGLYALKRIGSGKPKTAYERFAREVAALRSIAHPNIVRVVDCSNPDDEVQFYVMEWFEEARSLKKVIGPEDNPYFGHARKSLELFVQIMSALVECERLKIVHRDLSPGNVLVCKDGAKLIDFGLCQIESDQVITLVDEGLGTPNYMAPECESGVGKPVLCTADLYSAGKLLWSAVSNRLAFSREESVYSALSMQSLFPQIPSTWHLHHVFSGTIRHSVADRFPSAEKAKEVAEHVIWMIDSGKMPLLHIADERICPSCGWGRLNPMSDDWQVFHNPLPSGYEGRKCSYCGLCWPVHYKTIRDTIAVHASLK